MIPSEVIVVKTRIGAVLRLRACPGASHSYPPLMRASRSA